MVDIRIGLQSKNLPENYGYKSESEKTLRAEIEVEKKKSVYNDVDYYRKSLNKDDLLFVSMCILSSCSNFNLCESAFPFLN